MRIALAVLAWAVLVVVVLGSLLSVASQMMLMRVMHVGSGGVSTMLFQGVARALFNILIAVGVWASLPYLLDVDKRVRAQAVAREML